jgi:hypothetical protein
MPRKGNRLSEPNFQKKIPPRHQGQKGQGQRYKYQRDSPRVTVDTADNDSGKSKSAGKANPEGQGQSQRHGGPGKSAYSANALVAVDDGKVHPSLLRVLAHTYWVPFLMGQVLYLVYTLLQFVNPMVLK